MKQAGIEKVTTSLVSLLMLAFILGTVACNSVNEAQAPTPTPTPTPSSVTEKHQFDVDQKVIQLAASTFYSDRQAGWHDVNGDDNPQDASSFTDNVWGRSKGDTEAGHYYPTAIGYVSNHILGLSTSKFDPGNLGNALVITPSGSAATDAEIQTHAIWMGLLVNEAGNGTTSEGSQDRDWVSPLSGQGSTYLNRIPDSAMTGNNYNGRPAPGGGYCWVVGLNGRVFGAYKSDDGNWYSGFVDTHPVPSAMPSPTYTPTPTMSDWLSWIMCEQKTLYACGISSNQECRESAISLVITDPDGLILSDQINQIPGAYYSEYNTDSDGNGICDISLYIPNRKPGKYLYQAIPKPWAKPTDTFNIEISVMDGHVGWTTIWLAKDVPISEIPDEPYVFENKERVHTKLTYTGDTVGYYKEIAKLSAVLTDEDGHPLAGKVVVFNFSGRPAMGVTDSEGIARASLTLLMEPSEYYIVETNFRGDIDYLPPYDPPSPAFAVLPSRAETDPLESVWTSYKMEEGNWLYYTIASEPEWQDDSAVTAIAVDKQNNKWFGTINGVSKFDGKNWTNYTTQDGLAGQKILTIAIDSEGHKWFGTDTGVSMFDDKKWTTYTPENGLAGTCVYAIAIDKDGNKWFGTCNGASKFDGKNWTSYTVGDGLGGAFVFAIAIDNQGNKWFGTDNGVSKFDGKKWTTYTTENGLAGNRVTAIAIDKQNNKWFGTDGGLCQFDGAKWSIYVPEEYNQDMSSAYFMMTDNEGSDFTAKSIPAIAIDANGNLWCIVSRSNAECFPLSWLKKFDGAAWTGYTYYDGLASYFNVFAIAVDRDGNKWFGTDSGVTKLGKN